MKTTTRTTIAPGPEWADAACVGTIDKKGLGGRIREARVKAGLSQAALAEKIGVRPQSVFRQEAQGAVPAGDVLMRLSCALDVTPYWLMCGEEPVGSIAARPPHPSLDVFFETPEGSTVTKAEERELRRLRFPFEPSHLTWHYALMTLRSVPTVRPAALDGDEHESQIKKRGIK